MNNFIVPTNVAYSSYILNSNLNTLYRKFPFLDIKSVGVSNLGNPINVIRLSTGNKKVFYSAVFPHRPRPHRRPQHPLGQLPDHQRGDLSGAGHL